MASNLEATTAGTVAKDVTKARQFQALFDVIPFKVSLTDTTVAAQVATQVTVTVPGAALTDFVLLSPASDTGALVGYAAVSAADTVKITFFNTQGTDADTSLAGGATAFGLLLKPKSANSVWASL